MRHQALIPIAAAAVLAAAGAAAWALASGDESSPPAAGHDNKVLWVSRIAPSSAADLRIEARRYAAG